MSLPTADDLFRPSRDDTAEVPQRRREMAAVPDAPEPMIDSGADGTEQARGEETVGKPSRRSSGRVRHDEKMTVYVTADELLELEHARLALRRDGVTADRGRLVREAIAIALADLEANGEDSALVQRLTGR